MMHMRALPVIFFYSAISFFTYYSTGSKLSQFKSAVKIVLRKAAVIKGKYRMYRAMREWGLAVDE